jgi:hypothetical protein
MFKKVLIAEDQQMASISIVKTMESLGIVQRQYTYYCDDALMHIRKALQSGEPYGYAHYRPFICRGPQGTGT